MLISSYEILRVLAYMPTHAYLICHIMSMLLILLCHNPRTTGVGNTLCCLIKSLIKMNSIDGP